MHLSDWSALSDTMKVKYLSAALFISADLSPNRCQRAERELLDNVWLLTDFVKEINKTMDAGKIIYSAQRIYDYLIHKYTTRGTEGFQKHLNFKSHAEMSQTIARVLTVLFGSELIGFFDEQGVAA